MIKLVNEKNLLKAIAPDDEIFSGDNEWVTSSIFSPMNIWPLVLTEINNFLDQNAKDIICFTIGINYSNGPHIRLALLTLEQNKQIVGYNLKLRFKSFFGQFLPKQYKIYIRGIFLPLPSYTIEFGLYDFSFHQRQPEQFKNEQEISRVLIEVLQRDEIDLGSITVFSFYLQTCFLKVIMRLSSIGATFIDLLIGNDKNLESKKNMSKDNFELLNEITVEIMTTDTFEYESMWINRWIWACEHRFHSKFRENHYEPAELKAELLTFYKDFAEEIHKMLSIPATEKVFLEYAIKSCMRQFFKWQKKR